jgi:hypothetical protein
VCAVTGKKLYMIETGCSLSVRQSQLNMEHRRQHSTADEVNAWVGVRINKLPLKYYSLSQVLSAFSFY